MIDVKRLAAEVSVQHGIRIDADDPMMVVVTLNRLVFEAAVGQVIARVESAVREFDAAAEKVQVRAGGALAQEVRDAGVAMRQEFGRAFEESLKGTPGSQIRPGETRWRDVWIWVVSLVVFATLCFGAGVWFGNAKR